MLDLLGPLLVVLMGLIVQLGLAWAAPTGYGLSRWITLALPSSSGYFSTAQAEVDAPWTFWRNYPAWVQRQDELHIGTHPPGLVLGSAVAMRWFREHPAHTRAVLSYEPASVALAFETIVQTASAAERAAVDATAAATGLLALLTVVPLYALARASVPAPHALAAAALWPVMPAVFLFHPASDTALAFPAALAMALAAWSTRVRPGLGAGLAALSGIVFALGMQVSLVFLAVGLVVFLATLANLGVPLARRVLILGIVGAAFLLVTLALWALSGANPFAIWWANQQNHARFYQTYPRSYLAWVGINPLELAVALGWPVVLWAVMARSRRSDVSRWALATLAVLAVLTLTGRSLSEIARLWIPLDPPLVAAAGAGLARLEASPRDVALTVLLQGILTLGLQSLIQVVFPLAG
jgi:hypothetical protein